jgi:cytochrome c oxidase subunit 2
VVPEEEFRAWYFGDERAPLPGKNLAARSESAHPPIPGEPEGLSVMRTKGCLACHSTDGRTMVGPTFKGIFGRSSEVVVADLGGAQEVRTMTADEAYLRRSIQHPRDQVVRGYPPAMPTAALQPREVDEVVSYLKSLK